MLNIFQAIKLYKKFNKAYKESKKLMKENKKVLNETKKAVATLQTDFYSLTVLLPAYKDLYEEVKEIVKNAF